MKHTALDIYDDMPYAMRQYISQYGFHFSKKACNYATSRMKRKNQSTNKIEPIEPWSKEQVEDLLSRNGVTLTDSIMYDHVYVANMARTDYYKSSLPDEAHIALYVKDTLEDVDGSDELPFRYWLQRCIAMGEPVEFEDLL